MKKEENIDSTDEDGKLTDEILDKVKKSIKSKFNNGLYECIGYGSDGQCYDIGNNEVVVRLTAHNDERVTNTAELQKRIKLLKDKGVNVVEIKDFRVENDATYLLEERAPGERFYDKNSHEPFREYNKNNFLPNFLSEEQIKKLFYDYIEIIKENFHVETYNPNCITYSKKDGVYFFDLKYFNGKKNDIKEIDRSILFPIEQLLFCEKKGKKNIEYFVNLKNAMEKYMKVLTDISLNSDDLEVDFPLEVLNTYFGQLQDTHYNIMQEHNVYISTSNYSLVEPQNYKNALRENFRKRVKENIFNFLNKSGNLKNIDSKTGKILSADYVSSQDTNEEVEEMRKSVVSLVQGLIVLDLGTKREDFAKRKEILKDVCEREGMEFDEMFDSVKKMKSKAFNDDEFNAMYTMFQLNGIYKDKEKLKELFKKKVQEENRKDNAQITYFDLDFE